MRNWTLSIWTVLLFFPAVMFAQDEDSVIAVPKGQTKYTLEQFLHTNPDQLTPVDSGLKGDYNFDPGYLQNLGNHGTPSFQLVPQLFTKAGFNFGFNQWNRYLYNPESLKYYNTQNPYTDFRYVQGSVELQKFSAIHSQNILPNWNFAIDYNRMRSKGFYEHQQTSFNNLGVNTWYRSPNRRYMLLASAIFNNFQAQENGGIANDSIFRIASPGQRTHVFVNMQSGKQTWAEGKYSLSQFYYVGKTTDKKWHDTDKTVAKILAPRYFISHTFSFHQNTYRYLDAASDISFFADTFLNPDSTKDQYLFRNFSNTISIGHPASEDSGGFFKKVFLEGFIKHEYIDLKEPAGMDTTFPVNLSVGGVLEKQGKTFLHAEGQVYYQGYNIGDHLVRGLFRIPVFRLRKTTMFQASANVQRYHHSFTENLFIGNHFRWNNHFIPTQAEEAEASLVSINYGLKFTVSYAVITNLIYFDQFAMPQQADIPLQYSAMQLNKNFRLGAIHFDNDIIYQHVLEGHYVRVPEWVIRSSLYAEGRTTAWKGMLKAIYFSGGVNFSYNSAFHGYAYMPSTSKFYLQDKIVVGNYPVFDVFVAGRVRRFNFFAKVEHINQGMSGSNYFLLPHYPLYPRTLRLGLRWTFYN